MERNMFGRKKEKEEVVRNAFTADKFLKFLKQEGYEIKKTEKEKYLVKPSILLYETLDGEFSKELCADVLKPQFFNSDKVEFQDIMGYVELKNMLDVYANHLDNTNSKEILNLLLNKFDNQDLMKNAKVIAYYKTYVENDKMTARDVIENLAQKEKTNEVSKEEYNAFKTQDDFSTKHAESKEILKENVTRHYKNSTFSRTTTQNKTDNQEKSL